MQQLSAFMELFKAGAAPGSRREGQCWGWPRVLPRGGQVSPKGPSGLSQSYHAMVPALMRRVSPKWSGFRGRVGAAATCPSGRGEVSPLRLISPILGHVPVTFPTLICRNPTQSQTTCWAKPYVVTTSRHTASIRMAMVTRKATDCIAMCQAQS